MSNYDLLSEIIQHLEQFEKETEKVDLESFVLYLKDSVLLSKYSDKNEIPDFKKSENHDYKNFVEVEFATLLTNMYRFAKHYLKKAFKESSFKTIDEFSFLATLIKEKSLLKSELINRHLLEISTGSEVLRRLIKEGLIYEYKDEDDGRAKRVALTPQGYNEVTTAFNEMYKVAQIVKGNLFEEELRDAVIILKKLSFFHWDIHSHDKDTELDGLFEKYVTKSNQNG